MENISPLLYTEGSLTEALRQSFQGPIRIEVLREVARPCLPAEFEQLHEKQLWLREVLIRADRPLILARTRIGLSQAQGRLKPITELGAGFLGDWMFKQNSLHRLSLKVDESKQQRESVYELDGAMIWIQESFL